ncbi:Crp/Fnr family transcriptional regulator [Ekhidna sp.]|uniref:Crp/Fnr family transcriptional regulator n=1 Tax=Ekhidna sp. TaxID=2608089 RepID=UPI0032EBE05E
MNPERKQLLDSAFGNYVNISDGAYSYLEAHFHEKKYAAREIIVESGGQAKYFYLVISGVQAIYIINQKGEKVVLGFSFSGNISGIYDSFLSRKPSSLFLEAITPSKMIGINRRDYIELFGRFPEFYEWRTHFIEQILFGRISREVELMTLPAKERFDAFVKRCPQELLDIPQKYLASYLNMKPETFSRLRALRD